MFSYTKAYLSHISPLPQFCEVLMDFLIFSELLNPLKKLRILCKPGNVPAPLYT